jgi:hypothetical protein
VPPEDPASVVRCTVSLDRLAVRKIDRMAERFSTVAHQSGEGLPDDTPDFLKGQGVTTEKAQTSRPTS